ncbi:hypothetical protein BATDEDRAFT_85132 [Batrachochytrium dendrobatidis JAM81]|uniref:tRNA (guanine(37)-N(1))-methyltransferase n=2 Tax=Batrachochytrium dendrobatidis TaxID=109871 RepID=TRM5_BATDJ|nr:tRNA (guanine) methyltransferase [Batrachochytrium dendrobatidis JAM81]F4NUJ6.1 RecName: Full=tRNA (guanine(37)-N1)-methyltransferase; AltName: Full=M1G-methyltransferase; AltName: Full=tRNA [GM37] methyltransferase; AltName: Full=tRNA methyltransferase 5 [Batrachochytrium dendrobatidis JAM81]EGF83617.1 hypothetical protein BATDEDRAFT_85132 [Batrachochytrium dendrobatidis JAM81]OAJ37467.1 tRNA (guanine(37)-N1)-methyltransferase [Batrachochytrium dendrobatidis JEL423]|eukprot:XP_006676159.1 hypothetical protein BATDEDRAFT_85132 [Batrachochytrium dendrobatidis JAM81]
MKYIFAPPANKGLQQLNHALFESSHTLPALKIPAHASGIAMETLRSHILVAPRLRTIVDDPTDKKWRLLLLDPSMEASEINDLPNPLKEFALKHEAKLVKHTIELKYDYWTSDQVLRSILPDEMETPGAFETVGHIAHLNLRDRYQPFKHIIGQVILDKSSHIKTVVNKLDNIDHTFRFFQMEILAGINDMNAKLKEGGCFFHFDFSKVYWNSRLQGEHDRIIKLFGQNDLICDVFAGVGPFALPAAKHKRCVVFANDLNPQSFKYLMENIKLNKLETRILPFNMDGRQFIKQSLEDLNNPAIWNKITKQKPTSNDKKRNRKVESPTVAPLTDQPAISGIRHFKHYVMNLPATAIEFLDAFHGLYSGMRDVIMDSDLPTIHCHCFSNAKDVKADVIERVERVIGMPLGSNLIMVHSVRTVAPNKDMLCISFRLPSALAFAEPKILGKRKGLETEENLVSQSDVSKSSDNILEKDT